MSVLTERATAAKARQPEIGFMKHFKRLAEEILTRAEFECIDHEATRRDVGAAGLSCTS
jgi:hypothetical protein